VSDVNRPTDVDLSTKIETVKVDLGGRDENQVITALLKADSAYGDDLDYDAFANPSRDRSAFVADDGHNSNSYVAGALKAVGLEAPALKSNVPGYDKPVPEDQFEPKQE
jgi:hypothetical protein